MSKMIQYGENASKSVLNGVNKLTDAVAQTLGPAGKSVAIMEDGSVHFTKDGVTVAKSIDLEDPFEQVGVQAVKEVAEKSDKVGDGTTTSTILAREIFRNGLKYVTLNGSNPVKIKDGIMAKISSIVEYIKTSATPITSKDDIKKVAMVASNYDEEIADTIADVMSKLGQDGTIKIENGQTTSINYRIAEGMTIDNGYASPYLVTNQERMEAEIENPYVLIVNKKLANIQEMLPCLQSVSKTGGSLLIIADDYQEDILATIVMNRLRGFNVIAIKSPGYGASRKSLLEDIATLTGAKVISDELGNKIENAIVGTEYIGQCDKVVASKDTTVIIGGAGNKDTVKSRVASLKTQIENTEYEYERHGLEERVAKLTSGIGIISVGGTTEAEAKERRDRVDDAFAAAKSALKSGIVPGGGTALLNAKCCQFNKNNNEDADFLTGAKIVTDALTAPVRTILQNAGLNADVIGAKVFDCIANDARPQDVKMNNTGYNVLTGKIEDMLAAGIYDSAEVVMSEIKNAGSIASLLLTTNVLVVEKLEKDTNKIIIGNPQLATM